MCVLTGVQLFEYERGGSVVLGADPVEYQGQEYTYDGIAACEVSTGADGTVTYDITLREDVYFSDGEKLTADDVLFTMYVLADPAYDGPSGFSSLPIVGMSEYRSGMYVLSDMILSAGEGNEDFSYWTEEQQQAYWDKLKGDAGEQFAQDIVDYCIDNGYADDVATAMEKWGYAYAVEDGAEYTAADFFRVICEEYNYDYDAFAYEEAAGKSLFEITEEMLCLDDPIYGSAVMIGENEPTVSGIEKTGEFSVRVTTERYDAGTAYALAMNIAPLHYYGDEDLFDASAGKFGFNKGDISSVREATEPMGAGPYIFDSYEGGKVTFTVNENYYKGAAAFSQVSFIQYAGSADMVEAVAAGQVDICSPELSDEITSAVKDINGNGELTGEVITYSPVDFNGYGFIGINARKVCVNELPDSDQSKNLRKAFAILFAVYREEAIEDYYGELAEIIEYPMSSTSWAAPILSDAGYAQAYSCDMYGMPIYTEYMTREQRYAAALEAAIDCFAAAGYSWDYAGERFYAAPSGASLSYTVIVPGEGVGDHPCYAILDNASEALETIGIELVIDDPVDTNRLWTALNSGSQDMWCAAWSGTADPDLYGVYYSGNYSTNSTGSGKNHFYIADTLLDSKILDARSADVLSYRRNMYFDCLNIILDWAVEIPVYQRQQAYIYSTQRIDTDSLPQAMTPYRRWISEIQAIKPL